MSPGTAGILRFLERTALHDLEAGPAQLVDADDLYSSFEAVLQRSDIALDRLQVGIDFRCRLVDDETDVGTLHEWGEESREVTAVDEHGCSGDVGEGVRQLALADEAVEADELD